MKWSGRRDHLGGDMNPPVDTPSSSGQEARGSPEWSSIQRLAANVTLKKTEDNKKNNMSSQITPREAQKVWRLLQF